MRRFLLTLAALGLGFATIIDAFGVWSLKSDTTMTHDDRLQAAFGMIVVYAIALVLSMALSAPFALDPPDDFRQYWFWVPLIFLPIIWFFKLMGWIGILQLRLYWWLLSLVWSRIGRKPAPAAHPPTVYPAAPVPPTQHVPGPSWQNDPTGRYMKRYWDGRAWTSHVANGGVVTSDPI